MTTNLTFAIGDKVTTTLVKARILTVERVEPVKDGATRYHVKCGCGCGAMGTYTAQGLRPLKEPPPMSQQTIKWKPGPPPATPGRFWICSRGKVLPVELGPALLCPDGDLLIKTMSGVAYLYPSRELDISHHAPMELPAPPPMANPSGTFNEGDRVTHTMENSQGTVTEVKVVVSAGTYCLVQWDDRQPLWHWAGNLRPLEEPTNA